MSALKSAAAYAGVRIIGCLPLSFARLIGRALGSMAWLIKSQMAGTTRENIAYCFPELDPQQQNRLAKQSLRETGALAFETCVLFSRPLSWIYDRFEVVEGEPLMRSAMVSGKGVLVVAPHMGNWEIVGYWLAQLGPITNMYQPPKIASIDRLVRRTRVRDGASLVGTDMRGLAQFLKALKRGEFGGILPDQTPKADSAGVFSPFFNQPAFTMTLVHKLIMRSQCVVVFAYAKRVRRGGYELTVKSAPEGIYSHDEAISVAALNQGVEACVREVPEQYQWEYKRFRKKPPMVSEGNNNSTVK